LFTAVCVASRPTVPDPTATATTNNTNTNNNNNNTTTTNNNNNNNTNNTHVISNRKARLITHRAVSECGLLRIHCNNRRRTNCRVLSTSLDDKVPRATSVHWPSRRKRTFSARIMIRRARQHLRSLIVPGMMRCFASNCEPDDFCSDIVFTDSTLTGQVLLNQSRKSSRVHVRTAAQDGDRRCSRGVLVMTGKTVVCVFLASRLLRSDSWAKALEWVCVVADGVKFQKKTGTPISGPAGICT
jgi:hypothetical protein